jgi:hypothetical protein
MLGMGDQPTAVPPPSDAHISIWAALMLGLKGLLQSRKAVMGILTTIANIALHFGFQIDVEAAMGLTSPILAAIFGQTVVDVKNAGQMQTQKFDVSLAAAPPAAATAPTGSNAPVILALFFIGAALGAGLVMHAGCTPAARTAAIGAFIDCGESAIKAQAHELVPSFTENLKNAIDGAGKVDRPKLESFAAPLKSAAARCGFDAAIAGLINPPKAKDGSPQSSPFPVDHADLADAYNSVRESAWGGVELKSTAAQ